jgi:hypothetical protein
MLYVGQSKRSSRPHSDKGRNQGRHAVFGSPANRRRFVGWIAFSEMCRQSKIRVFHHVFDSLHSLYEELKLTSCMSLSDSSRVVSLLVVLSRLAQVGSPCHSVTAQMFLDYYRREMGDEHVQSMLEQHRFESIDRVVSGDFASFARPPSICHGSRNR